MRGRIGAGLAASCLLGAGLLAQQTQQPVFRAGVELVTVDVTVVDKDGKPVRGLKAEDFVVTLQGQARPVRAIDFLEFGSSSGSDVTAPERTATNQPAPGAPAKRGGRTIVILFDDLSYRPGPGKLLTIAAQRMLPTFDADDLIGLSTTSGLGPVVNPTRDRSVLNAALQSKPLMGRDDDLSAPIYVSVNEALEIQRWDQQRLIDAVARRECPYLFPDPGPMFDVCVQHVRSAARRIAQAALHRTAMQVSAFQQVMNAIRKAPAPKVLIVLTRGLAAAPEHGELQSQLEPLARAAAEAGIEFYAMSEVPEEVEASDLSGDRSSARREEGRYLNQGAQVVANAAGGEAFLVVGQADRFYKRIEAETSAFYRLGVEAPVSQKPDRFLNAKVAVKAPGVTVRTHARAVVASAAAETLTLDEKLKLAVAQGGESFGVPIALGVALRRDPANAAQVQLGTNVQVPASTTGPLAAMFAIIDADGRIVQQGRAAMTQPSPTPDFQLALALGVEPGKYRLRLAVADAAGNVGSLEHGVAATLTQVGTIAVSDLLLSWLAADGAPHFLALETLPAAATTLRVALELYPTGAASANDVTVRLALVRLGQDDPVVESDLTPSTSNGSLGISASLPTETLAPGTYAIRATILQAGALVGTVSTSVRKVGGL